MNQSPLRILHLTAGSDAGGVSRYIHDLCQAMHEGGHQVAVAGQHGAWQKLFSDAPWPWIDVPLKGGPLALRRAVRILSQYLAEHPVDILHAHYRKATLVGRRLQNSGTPPLLYTLHLSHIPLRGPWRWATDFGDHVHAASSDAEQWLTDEAKVAPERITVIPHGIDANHFPIANAASRSAARAALNLGDDDLVALFVGRLDYPKNEDWLLDLAQASSQSLPRLRILLTGEGPNESSLRNRIERDRLGSRVRLLGQQPPLGLYHAADALLLPSLREGFSYACAEAMCAGVPVLRTRTSGTSELIVENVTGRSTRIDHDDFIRAAIEFLSDLPALRKMGAAAAQHIRERFTFTHQLDQTLALYRTLCQAGGVKKAR